MKQYSSPFLKSCMKIPHGLRTCVGLVDADGAILLFSMWESVRKVHICCRSVIVEEDMAFVRPTHAELA